MPGGARPRRPELGEHSLQAAREVVHDLVDEPDPQGGRSVEALPRDEVAPCGALADLPESERRDHGRDDPELHLREGEHRARLGEHDVAARDQPDAAPQRVALDESDHRRRARIDGLEHAAHGVRVRDVRLEPEVGRRAHPIDVGARAEARPVPGEHHRPGDADVDEGLGQLGDESGVERVARLRPGEGDAEDVSVSLDAERAHDAQPKVSPDGSEALHGAAGAVQKTATMFRVPFDREEAFGRARPPVETRKRRIASTVERVHEGRPLS